MSEIAIRVEKLSKRYRIGQREPYKMLREALTEAMYAPLRWLRSSRRSGIRNPNSQLIWALKDVSLEVKRGEVLGVIGRNGAGKTTLLKILCRVTEPTEGHAEIHGRVGSLLEVGTGFHPELTGRENIYLNGAILGMKRAEVQRKFDEIVDFAEIEKFMDTPVKRYSSGMYMRLAFAVAAHLEPEILLVDEVLAVGDIAFQRKCLGKMGDVAKEGRTVLLVSHNMAAVRKLCGLGCLLDGGRVVAWGDANSVVDAYYELVEEALGETPEGGRALAARQIPEGSVGYLGWQLQSAGAGTQYQCVTREGCAFEFRLLARRTVHAAGFSLSIFDGGGNWILGLRRGAHASECVELREGEYRVRFAVPSLAIRPGRYTLIACVGDLHEGILEQWHAEPGMLVLPREHAHVSEVWGGLFNAEGTVEVEPVGAPPRPGPSEVEERDAIASSSSEGTEADA
jgi:lipopolysaccharide transport system ATP-binding protein